MLWTWTSLLLLLAFQLMTTAAALSPDVEGVPLGVLFLEVPFALKFFPVMRKQNSNLIEAHNTRINVAPICLRVSTSDCNWLKPVPQISNPKWICGNTNLVIEEAATVTNGFCCKVNVQIGDTNAENPGNFRYARLRRQLLSGQPINKVSYYSQQKLNQSHLIQ